MTPPRPHYDTLGVKPDATQDEIKRVFRARAKQCHPDHHPGDKEKEARFKRISEAYAVLSDPDARRHYDETGEAPKGQENILGEACGLIVQTFQRIRDSAGDDIFFNDPLKRMKEAFNEGLGEAAAHIKKLQQKNKRNEKIAEKISHRAGSASFLHAALSDENRRNDEQIKEISHMVKVMEKAVEVLDEYSFAVEKRTDSVRDRRRGWPFIADDMAFTWSPGPGFKPFDPGSMRS